MDSLVKLVGINIKQIRKSKNMTQDELAEKCDLQTSYLAGVERGDRNITLQSLERIIVGLEVSPVHFFSFGSIDINQHLLGKKDLTILLNNLIDNKEEEEVRMILNIATEVFNTYRK